MHLVIDSTGLKLFGRGEWNAETHKRSHRSWRKLHLTVDSDTGEIIASVLTGNGVHDAEQVPVLLEQIEGEIASIMADGAYDREPVYQVIQDRQRSPAAAIIIPPRAGAVDRAGVNPALSQRDHHIRLIQEQGWSAWRKVTGYGRRSHAETAVGRYKSLIGPRMRARSLANQQGEAALATNVLNQMVRTGKPVSVRVA